MSGSEAPSTRCGTLWPTVEAVGATFDIKTTNLGFYNEWGVAVEFAVQESLAADRATDGVADGGLE